MAVYTSGNTYQNIQKGTTNAKIQNTVNSLFNIGTSVLTSSNNNSSTTKSLSSLTKNSSPTTNSISSPMSQTRNVSTVDIKSKNDSKIFDEAKQLMGSSTNSSNTSGSIQTRTKVQDTVNSLFNIGTSVLKGDESKTSSSTTAKLSSIKTSSPSQTIQTGTKVQDTVNSLFNIGTSMLKGDESKTSSSTTTSSPTTAKLSSIKTSSPSQTIQTGTKVQDTVNSLFNIGTNVLKGDESKNKTSTKNDNIKVAEVKSLTASSNNSTDTSGTIQKDAKKTFSFDKDGRMIFTETNSEGTTRNVYPKDLQITNTDGDYAYFKVYDPQEGKYFRGKTKINNLDNLQKNVSSNNYTSSLKNTYTVGNNGIYVSQKDSNGNTVSEKKEIDLSTLKGVTGSDGKEYYSYYDKDTGKYENFSISLDSNIYNKIESIISANVTKTNAVNMMNFATGTGNLVDTFFNMASNQGLMSTNEANYQELVKESKKYGNGAYKDYGLYFTDSESGDTNIIVDAKNVGTTEKGALIYELTDKKGNKIYKNYSEETAQKIEEKVEDTKKMLEESKEVKISYNLNDNDNVINGIYYTDSNGNKKWLPSEYIKKVETADGKEGYEITDPETNKKYLKYFSDSETIDKAIEAGKNVKSGNYKGLSGTGKTLISTGNYHDNPNFYVVSNDVNLDKYTGKVYANSTTSASVKKDLGVITTDNMHYTVVPDSQFTGAPGTISQTDYYNIIIHVAGEGGNSNDDMLAVASSYFNRLEHAKDKGFVTSKNEYGYTMTGVLAEPGQAWTYKHWTEESIYNKDGSYENIERAKQIVDDCCNGTRNVNEDTCFYVGNGKDNGFSQTYGGSVVYYKKGDDKKILDNLDVSLSNSVGRQ